MVTDTKETMTTTTMTASNNNKEEKVQEEEEEPLEGSSTKNSKRKMNHDEERKMDICNWIDDIRKVLIHRDSACVTLTSLTKQEFDDQWELGISVVIGSNMLFNCSYNGIVTPYATMKDAVTHLYDGRNDCQLWAFYGNYHDYFIGYAKRGLEGPVLQSEIQYVIEEMQRMLCELEKHYEKVDIQEEQRELEEGGGGDDKNNNKKGEPSMHGGVFPSDFHTDVPEDTLRQAKLLKQKVQRERNIESSVDDFFKDQKKEEEEEVQDHASATVGRHSDFEDIFKENDIDNREEDMVPGLVEASGDGLGFFM